jgi:hypothetical protein
VRSAVGAEKETRIARGRGPAQRTAMLFALRERQAVEVRPDPAGEDRITIDDQVMSRKGGRQVRAGGGDIGDSLRW